MGRLAPAALYAMLLWAPLASGAHRDWPLAALQLLALAGLLLWVLGMLARGRVEWRRTALDLPLGLLIGLVALQLVLGNGPLATWALAPPGADGPISLPTPLLGVGTIAPDTTSQALGLLLTYAGVYVLTVNLIRTRRQLEGLVQFLLALGGLLAAAALLDYMAGGGLLPRWQAEPIRGRLTGTFPNPDHWASWLAMVICLGIGYVAARGGRARPVRMDAEPMPERGRLERLLHRYLPAAGVGVMALALLFTLSRGGIASLLLASVGLLALLGAAGRARPGLITLGVAALVTAAYGAWIGLEPVASRLWHADYSGRWIQLVASLPMLRDFPVLGVGLGAYKEIFPRYQPLALEAGRIYYPYAHNDLLQFVIELGPLGALIGGWAVWRVARDLIGAHVLGRARCPVEGKDGERALRRDPFNVGIALGATAAVLALGLHSAVDFSARIPANGVLTAACLGMATVALHSRFRAEGTRSLAAVRAWSPGHGRSLRIVAAAAAAAIGLVAAFVLVRPSVVDALVLDARSRGDLEGVERALALAPRDARTLEARAQLRLEGARRLWTTGSAPGGALLATRKEREGGATLLLRGSVEDLRTALGRLPSNPLLHERLGWTYQTLAAADPAGAPTFVRSAITHLRRAIALGPENPFLHRSLAALALAQPEPRLDIALDAAREAVSRDPSLLPDLVDRAQLVGLLPAQWLRLVPDAPAPQLELGALLEARALFSEAEAVYMSAVERASGSEQPLARWLLARLLMRVGRLQSARAEIEAALGADPDNPELHLVRAQILATQQDPAALAIHQVALAKADAQARGKSSPFIAGNPRLAALVASRLGQSGPITALRYRRALAQYLTSRRSWGDALAEWDLVLAQAPSDPLAHFSKGLALDGLGAQEQALDAYRRAVALDGNTVPFRLRLAERLWESDLYFQAIAEWRAAAAQEPGNLEAHLALARAYTRVGDRPQAVREYQHVLAIAPEHAEARRGLGRGP